MNLRPLLGCCLAAGCLFLLTGAAQNPPDKEGDRYEQRTRPNPDGIGKFYLGREISHVMGHQGADWLERPEREAEERTSEMIESLRIQPGQQVADIGVGTGYIAWRLAAKVGERGTVHGVDIQPEMLELLQANMAKRGFKNVKSVLGTITDPKLPANTLDLIILVDVYHELSHPYEMMTHMVKALKPGGRIAFVEFKAEDPGVPIKRLHKMSEAQIKKEALVHPLEWVETVRTLPWQHVVIFRRKE